MTATDPGERGETTLTVERLDTTKGAVLRLVGELDVSTREVLLGCAECWAPGWAARQLTLDVGGLSFCDAAGLSALVQVAGMARSAGGRVGLTGASRRLRRLVAITGLGAVLPPVPASPAPAVALPGPAAAG